MRTTEGDPTHLVVGHITKPHGIKGEVTVRSLTDHPQGVYAPGVILYPAQAEGQAPDYDRPPLRVESVRPFRDGFLVLFGGFRDRNDAETLRGTYLLQTVEALEPLADDEVFHHQLLGMVVETVEGARVGTIREVFEHQPADLLEVRTARGLLLIPYTRQVVVEVDVEGGRLVVDPPEGLLELES